MGCCFSCCCSKTTWLYDEDKWEQLMIPLEENIFKECGYQKGTDYDATFTMIEMDDALLYVIVTFSCHVHPEALKPQQDYFLVLHLIRSNPC